MNNAEKFIKDYTRTCSNELIAVESRAGKEVVSYHEWLTPDQARRAVEIAREETINDMCDWIINGLDVNADGILTVNVKEFVKDLKQAMKDE